MKKPSVDIVIPVYNNFDILQKSILTQIEFYSRHLEDFNWRIVIVNNTSTDNTLILAKKLAKQFKKVTYIDISKKGRGNALKKAWSRSNANILSYMDVDLATDLNAFPELINNIYKGYDLSVGSKYIPGARSKRHIYRYLLSKLFNLLNILLYNAYFSDAQCGFKAISRNAVSVLLPKIKDGNWFFDTELLVLAQRNGFKIKEVPINWKELGMANKSGVKIFKTVFDFAFKMVELRFRRG